MRFFKLTKRIAVAIRGKPDLSFCPAAFRKVMMWIPEEDVARKASTFRMQRVVESHVAQANFVDDFFDAFVFIICAWWDISSSTDDFFDESFER